MYVPRKLPAELQTYAYEHSLSFLGQYGFSSTKHEKTFATIFYQIRQQS